jgi:hypothetical protein
MARKGGIDNNVYIIIAVFLVLLAVIVGFRILFHKTCPEVGFTVSTEEVIVGQPVVFSDTTTGSESWSWDLGDNSKHETTRSISHTYYEKGTYPVSLTINCGNTVTHKVTVIEALKIAPVDSVFVIKPEIGGPVTATVGQKIQFFDKTVGNTTSWEWFFESGMVDSREKNPFWTFLKPGTKTITLIVNGKSQQGRHQITIRNPPVKPGEKPVKSKPTLSEEEMSAKLMKVASKEIYPSYFDQFLCNGVEIPVIVNGRKFTFSSYCSTIRIQSPDRITVKEIVRDESKCPTSIVIDQKN